MKLLKCGMYIAENSDNHFNTNKLTKDGDDKYYSCMTGISDIL